MPHIVVSEKDPSGKKCSPRWARRRKINRFMVGILSLRRIERYAEILKMWLRAPATLVHVKRQRLQVGKDLQNFLSRGVKALKKAKGPEGKYEHPSVDKVKTYWTCLIGQRGTTTLRRKNLLACYNSRGIELLKGDPSQMHYIFLTVTNLRWLGAWGPSNFQAPTVFARFGYTRLPATCKV